MNENVLAKMSAYELFDRNLERVANGKEPDSVFLAKDLICEGEPLMGAYIRACYGKSSLLRLNELKNLLLDMQTAEAQDLTKLSNRAIYTLLLEENEYRAALCQLKVLKDQGDDITKQLEKLRQLMGFEGGLDEELQKAENKQVHGIYHGSGAELLQFDEEYVVPQVNLFSE